MKSVNKYVQKAVFISRMNMTNATFKTYITESSNDLPYDVYIYRDKDRQAAIIDLSSWLLRNDNTAIIDTAKEDIKDLPADLQDIILFMVKHHIAYGIMDDIDLYYSDDPNDIIRIMKRIPFLPIYHENTRIYTPSTKRKKDTGLQDREGNKIYIGDYIQVEDDIYVIKPKNPQLPNQIHCCNIFSDKINDTYPISELPIDETFNLTNFIICQS